MLKKKSEKVIDEEDEEGADIDKALGSPHKRVEPTLDVFDYAIILVGVIALISVLFLFGSVWPELGWVTYHEFVVYMWKPMSWMPLWIGIVLALLIFAFADFLKPVVIFGNDKKWYIRKYELNGLIHFKLLRSLGRSELIVYRKRVHSRGMMNIITHSDLVTINSEKDIHVEGSDRLEVEEIITLEKEIALLSTKLNSIYRTHVAETGRNFHEYKELERLRSQGGNEK